MLKHWHCFTVHLETDVSAVHEHDVRRILKRLSDFMIYTCDVMKVQKIDCFVTEVIIASNCCRYFAEQQHYFFDHLLFLEFHQKVLDLLNCRCLS